MKITTILTVASLSFMASPAVQAQSLPEAVVKHKEMVVTANPLATAAGVKVLKQGGNAVDAMVAVQTVLGLVEPQSSGIGGGAFIVYYDAKSGDTTTIDAREKAPAAATEDRFQDVGGFFNAWQSGLSVGVPGIPRMMEYMHDEYGHLPWRKLFRPAIKLAKNGFALTQRTSDQVAGLLARNGSCDDRLFFRDPTAFEYFANPDCTAKPAGTIIQNKDYAKTMRTLRRDGADGFYTGKIAKNIAAAVQTDPNIGGDMTVEDLANYNVVERDPVCIDYRRHEVCGMGPPSSGALAVGQILGILENFDIGDGNPLDVETVHLFTQAGRLAFADRGLYVGDSDFVTVPVEGMLDKDYLASRAALITDMDMGRASPGIPPGDFDPSAPDNRTKDSGTSHVSIVDRYGNALSMTTTIESSFGNGVMVNGFLLNNELTDFSFASVDSNGLPIANRVQPNKRPRSSMSPSIVFDKYGRVKIVTGSPGGSRIIGYTAQSIVNMIDFGLDPQEAINVPHYMNRNGRTDIEQPIPGVTLDYDAEALAAALKERGHSDPTQPLEDRSVGIITQTSGLSIIQIKHKRKRPHWWWWGWRHYYDDDYYDDDYDDDDDYYWNKHRKTRLIGGADHRRDGTVGGR